LFLPNDKYPLLNDSSIPHCYAINYQPIYILIFSIWLTNYSKRA